MSITVKGYFWLISMGNEHKSKRVSACAQKLQKQPFRLTHLSLNHISYKGCQGGIGKIMGMAIFFKYTFSYICSYLGAMFG